MRYDEAARGSGSDNSDARRAEYPNYLQRIKDVFLLARQDVRCASSGLTTVQVIHLMPSHRIVTRGAIYFAADDGQHVSLVGVGCTAKVVRRETPDRGGAPVTGVVYAGGFPSQGTSIDDPNNMLTFLPGPADNRAVLDGFAFTAHSQGEDQIFAEFALGPVFGAGGAACPGEWRYKWSYEPGPGLSMLSGEWELLARSCRAWPVLPGNRAVSICARPPT